MLGVKALTLREARRSLTPELLTRDQFVACSAGQDSKFRAHDYEICGADEGISQSAAQDQRRVAILRTTAHSELQ